MWRRAVELTVGFFALLGFVWVPLGQRTGYEHVRAILATGPAAEAGRELVQAAVGLRDRWLAGRGPEPVPAGPKPVPPPLVRAADAGADASLPYSR
jgi:hypothetical protein